MAFIGLDIGSATVKVCGIDGDGNILGTPLYVRHDAFPSPVEALKSALHSYLEATGTRVQGIGATGSGRALMQHVVGADLVRTEILAHAAGARYLLERGMLGTGREPVHEIGTILEIGGQDAKVILFDRKGMPSHFHMNSICAAGTGEFLKQLSDEIGTPLQEFGPIALASRHPARIDATCTVFAKRDFRHLTQKGVPLADRLMGVCQAMVENYLDKVVGRERLSPPYLFQGGVAHNPAMRQAFEERLGAPVHVPPYHDVAGALGMAVLVRASLGAGGDTAFREDFFAEQVESRLRYCHGCANGCEVTQPVIIQGSVTSPLEPMGGRCEGCLKPGNLKEQPRTVSLPAAQRRPAPSRGPVPRVVTGGVRHRSAAGRLFAAIDGGSRGTKYALLRATEDAPQVLAVGSIDTSGDALQACRKALVPLREAVAAAGGEDLLGGIATTGSAGELFRDMLTTRTRRTSDVFVTEILAHFAWARHQVPAVGTVVDIGGNDAKIIFSDQGTLQFAMNDKCAAGTGAFLEAVARRFSVPIEEYGEMAARAGHPALVAGRCAVFGESDVIHKSRSGYATPDLLSGVAYSITRTYLSDVARGRPLAAPVVAQGGTFLNRAVQTAFKELLGLSDEEFYVADDPRLVVGAGALGAALWSLRHYEEGDDSAFRGFERVLAAHYETASGTCRLPGCHRVCNGVVLLQADGIPLAGYQSVDCPEGLFDGMLEDPHQVQRTLSAFHQAEEDGHARALP